MTKTFTHAHARILVGLVLGVVCLSSLTDLYAQAPRQQLYYDPVDYLNPDPELSIVARDIDRTSDDGHVLIGHNLYFDPLTGTKTELANITKLSSCGTVDFSKKLRHMTGLESRGGSVRETKDGGFIITGSVKRNNISGNNWDIFLMKTDYLARVTWYQIFRGLTGDDHGTSVREVYDANGDPDGYILTGAINIYTDYGICDNPDGYENATLVVIRTNMSGAINWHQEVQPTLFGCPGTPPNSYNHYTYGHDIEQLKDGAGMPMNKFVVTGTYRTVTMYSFDPLCPQIICTQPASSALLAELDDVSGTITWLQTYPMPSRNGQMGNTTGYSVLQTATGFVVGGTTEFSPVDHDVYLLETTMTGAQVNAFTYDAGAIETGRSIEVTNDSYYLFGSITDATGLPQTDGLIMEVDRSNWNSIKPLRFGGSNTDGFIRSVPEPDDHFSTVGQTNSYTPTDDYYLISHIGKKNYEECDQCIGEAILAGTQVTGPQPIPSYNHEMLIQETEIGHWQLFQTFKNTECECSCPDVDITFQHAYGHFVDRGRSFRQTTDEGYIVAGYSSDHESTNANILTFRTDDMGIPQWGLALMENPNLGRVYDEFAFSVRQTLPDEGFVFAGEAFNNTANDRASYVFKTKADGTPQWSLMIGEETSGSNRFDDGLRSIKQIDENSNGQFDLSDGYVIAGFRGKNVGEVPFEYDAYFGKIAVNGSGNAPTQTVFLNRFGVAGGDEFFQDVIQTDDDNDGVADDGYIAVGYSNSTFPNQPASMGGYNVLVVKFNKNGTKDWAKIYGGDNNNDEVAFSIYQTDDNYDGKRDDGFVIAGATGNITLDNLHDVDMGASTTDIYILKIGHDGSMEGHTVVDQGPNAIAYSILQTTDYSLTVAGETTVGTNVQALLFKMNNCGTEISWANQYPVDPNAIPAEDHIREHVQTQDGGYALFGSTCSYSDQGGTAAKGDFYLVKTDCTGEVCFSDQLTIDHDICPSLVYSVDIGEYTGGEDEEGAPYKESRYIHYPICPEEEGSAPAPGSEIDLGWMIRRH